MSQSYEITFRERAVAAYHAGEGGYHELARLFGIAYRTLQRWVALERATGSVAPRPNGGGWRCPIDLKEMRRSCGKRQMPPWQNSAGRTTGASHMARTSRTSFGRAMRRADFVLT